ncbi:MAG TPA: NUDIX hydrolase [Gaiellaceae bacterium]|nr:NUDIX hydrolase [Gaiellaceae bacterium]
MELIQHPPSVVLIAVEGGELVLVRQSRPGSGTRTLELPSGKLEDGEAPAEAAARELAEECGLAAQKLSEVGTFWAAPGYSTELVHVFEASGLSKAEPAERDDDEDIEVERLPLANALEKLDDAASIAALALWLEGR